jgi:hypothetical protein
MPRANEILLDREVGHQVNLQRLSNGVVRRMIALLNRLDADLFAQITTALERLPPESFTVERLEGLLSSIRALNAQAYDAIVRALPPELRQITDYEAGFQLKLFESAIPQQVIAQAGVNAVNAQQVYAAALSRPFQGRLLSEWMQSLEADRGARVRDAIRIGYGEGQTLGQIVTRLRGTRARNYEDGIIEIDRRNAEAVVRTAVSHVAANTKDLFYAANKDLVRAVQWLSTLDTRTTLQCQVRDGLTYTPESHKPIDHGVPWLSGPGKLHWNCRSSSVPILRSFRDLGIPIDELSETTRASMDGQVPAETTYNEWLTKQSAARQDEVLGPTRGKLYRNGGLPIDRFTNDKGVFLTLDELRKMDAAAFNRAGV